VTAVHPDQHPQPASLIPAAPAAGDLAVCAVCNTKIEFSVGVLTASGAVDVWTHVRPPGTRVGVYSHEAIPRPAGY
jgi:hypothetical protein